MRKSEISGIVFGLIGRNDNIEMKKLIKSTLSTLCLAEQEPLSHFSKVFLITRQLIEFMFFLIVWLIKGVIHLLQF